MTGLSLATRELIRPPAGGGDVSAIYIALDKLLYGIYVVFPNLETFNFKAAATYGIPLDPALLGMALLYAAIYIGVMLAISSLVFRKRIL